MKTNMSTLVIPELMTKFSTRQPSIARLEKGSGIPSLSFLKKVAVALNAKIELRLVPDSK
jgi:predicted transcriptional regulator